MKTPTSDDQQDVRGRLDALAFPVDHAAQVAWCRELVGDGTLERNAITEHLMRGATIPTVASVCGITELRVYHHLGKPAGFETAGHNRWRIKPVSAEWE